MKPQICDAIIELTRRCNMKCEHCLRGPAQKIDQTKANIDKFFVGVGSICNLTFTGGEPSLVPELIDYVRESAIRHEVDVGSFYIVTNGKSIDEKFVIACLRWWAYCHDNEVSGVELSRDDFHDDKHTLDYKLLKGLAFFREKHYQDSKYIIAEGRAKNWLAENYIAWEGRKVGNEMIRVREDENCGFTVDEGVIYLNCKGELIAGCDWSYRNQTRNKICNVGELSLEVLEDFGADIDYLNSQVA